MTQSERQVVVTGSAALCPAGIGLEALRAWWRAPGEAVHVPGFQPASIIRNARQLRTMQRLFQLAASAAILALESAGLPDGAALALQGLDPDRAGTAVAIGDISPVTADLLEVLRQVPLTDGRPDWARFGEIGVHQLHPFRRLTLLPNMAAAHVSLLLGLQGPSCSFTSGARAGEQAVTEAYWMIAGNHADFMVIEAADTPDHAFTAAPVKEAAAALTLESMESARRRGVPVLAVFEPDPSLSQSNVARTPVPSLPVAGSLLEVVAWLAGANGVAASSLALPGLRLLPAHATARGGEA